MQLNLLDRFWSKVYKDPISDCWLWTASLNAAGYGQFYFNGKTTLSHRASWILNNSEIPKNSHVLHKCDVRNCVNPDHLFLGTQEDNIVDMVCKGRQSKCENHGSAKLTNKKVKEIRKMYHEGNVTQKALGKMFKIRTRGIWGIVNNRSWKGI